MHIIIFRLQLLNLIVANIKMPKKKSQPEQEKDDNDATGVGKGNKGKKYVHYQA